MQKKPGSGFTSRLRPPGPGSCGSRPQSASRSGKASSIGVKVRSAIRVAQPKSVSSAASKSCAPSCKPSGLRPPKESVLKKFDRSINEELKRRADPANVLVEATTNDLNLLDAVDHLTRAEAMHSFAATVRAAEQAASEAPPELAEEAACVGARNFEAELVDIIQDEVPGLKPIQVIGYIGITRPKRAAR